MIDFNKYKFSTSTHWIANSGKDENSGTQGGKAGDQTGHEAEVRKYYVRPWTVVLRYPDQAVADKIADLSIAMCLNDNVGYDQGQRTTYWTQLKAVGYDPSKIDANHKAEGDCTSEVSANAKAAGALFGIKALENLPICTSRNMRQEFTRAGFVALTASKYLTSPDYLLPGDILLYENHHAACNLTVGSKVREQWNPEGYAAQHPQDGLEPPVEEIPEYELPAVQITGSSVFVRKGPSTDYGSLGVVHQNDRLHYFGYTYPENGWYLVEFEKQTGWVSGKYGRLEGA